MSLHEYLQNQQEEIPHWLDQFEDGAPFLPQQFFGSRVVYYPGSGTDGHPVQLFGSTHSAHSFVYADYRLNQADLESELEHPRYGFRGYHTLARHQLRQSDLVPVGWVPHIRADEIRPDIYGFAAVGLDHNPAHPRHAATSASAGRLSGRGRFRRGGGGRSTCASTCSNRAG